MFATLILATAAFVSSPDPDARARLQRSVQNSLEAAAYSGQPTVLCPSRDGRACRRAPDWSDGWIAFVDGDGDREHAPHELLLLAEAPMPAGVRLRSTLGRARLVFHADAAPDAGFTLCDTRGATQVRGLALARDGTLAETVPASASIAATCPSSSTYRSSATK